MTHRPVFAAALLLALPGGAAHADGFSFGSLFNAPSPTDKSQIRQAAHNHYAPYDGVEDVPPGGVFASGHYTSRARADAVHDRYAD